jgi:hypothetical protein
LRDELAGLKARRMPSAGHTLNVIRVAEARCTIAVLTLSISFVSPKYLYARDDGRFANSPLKEGFDRLASRNGLYCAFADGVSLQDVDWDSQEGHYRVVPDAVVVAEPNRDRYGNTQIRCFTPGAGT